MANKTSDHMLLFGTLAGAAIGAAVALVHAPDDGQINRKHLTQWAKARVEEVRDKAQNARPGHK